MQIIAYATTRAESLRNFRQEFAAIWHHLAEEADDALTVDAIELRDAIRSLVKEARPIQ